MLLCLHTQRVALGITAVNRVVGVSEFDALTTFHLQHSSAMVLDASRAWLAEQMSRSSSHGQPAEAPDLSGCAGVELEEEQRTVGGFLT